MFYICHLKRKILACTTTRHSFTSTDRRGNTTGYLYIMAVGWILPKDTTV